MIFDKRGNDPRVIFDTYENAILAARSQLGSCRPDDDEPEEQWHWDKLTSLLELLKGQADE